MTDVRKRRGPGWRTGAAHNDNERATRSVAQMPRPMQSPPEFPDVSALRVHQDDGRKRLRDTARLAIRQATALLDYCDADETDEQQYSLPLAGIGKQHPRRFTPRSRAIAQYGRCANGGCE